MKKSLASLVLAAMMLASACGSGGTSGAQSSSQMPAPLGGVSIEPAQSAQGDASVPAPAESEEVRLEGNGSNILVAYFSRVGNTVWEDGVDAVTSATLNVVDVQRYVCKGYFHQAQIHTSCQSEAG